MGTPKSTETSPAPRRAHVPDKSTPAAVTDEVLAAALRMRDAEPGVGWGAVAAQLGVSKTSLQRRAKRADAAA